MSNTEGEIGNGEQHKRLQAVHMTAQTALEGCLDELVLPAVAVVVELGRRSIRSSADLSIFRNPEAAS